MAPLSAQQQEYDSDTAAQIIRDTIEYYKGTSLYDNDLWESSKDRIAEYIEEDVIRLADRKLNDDLFALRTLLRQRGVNIHRRLGLRVVKAFEDWLLEEEYGH